MAVGPVAIPQQKPWRRVPRERVADLLGRPRGRGVPRTVQKLDRALDDQPCITPLPGSSSSACPRGADGTGQGRGWWCCRWRVDQSVVQALVISLVMIVLDELADGATQRALTNEHHPFEAGFLDGADEAFRVGVQVWRAGGQSDGVTPAGGSVSRMAGRKSGSRSWMRNRMFRRNPSWMSVAFRMSWVTQGPSAGR